MALINPESGSAAGKPLEDGVIREEFGIDREAANADLDLELWATASEEEIGQASAELMRYAGKVADATGYVNEDPLPRFPSAPV